MIRWAIRLTLDVIDSHYFVLFIPKVVSTYQFPRPELALGVYDLCSLDGEGGEQRQAGETQE